MFLDSIPLLTLFSFFFFNDTATTEIYTLSLHDALPIFLAVLVDARPSELTESQARRELTSAEVSSRLAWDSVSSDGRARSEEHTSELQSHLNLVCRLLLEKKKKQDISLH